VRTIVVADDDAYCRRVLARALTNSTTQVYTAADGSAAYRLVRSNNSELLLTDLYMPKMNGLKLIERLQREGRETSCLLMTGFPSENLDNDARTAGATRVMFKPVDVMAIRTAVHAELTVRTCSVPFGNGASSDLENVHTSDRPASQERGPMAGSWTADAKRLAAQLARSYPALGLDRAWDVVIDTMLAMSRSARNTVAPPSAGAVLYLARFRAQNVIASDQARRRRETRWAAETSHTASGSDGTDRRAKLAALVRDIVDMLPDDRCRDVFIVWLSGERELSAFTRVLGIDQLPVTERRQIVRREKDRLRKCLRRDQRIRSAAEELRRALGQSPD
jgi:two-component system, chemotaxis family, chemotaxis protein CheY